MLIVLVLAGLATNFFTEYQLGGFNGYAIKHLVLFSIVLILSVIWKLKWMTTSLLFIIMIYINIIPSTIYLPFRIADVNLNFEAYFSRMEMIVFVMDLLLAVFEKPWHQFVVMGYNTIFIIACAMLYPDLPIGKYILTFLMILSVGAVSSKVIRLQNELQEQHQLVSVQSEELLELTSFGKDIMKMIAHDLRTPIHQISMLPTIIGSSDSKTDRNNYLAIRNLITNAIKFSPQNQRILVDNMEDENHFSLRVHNRAGAINKEKLSKINTGQMVTSSLSTKKEKGCGEGLFICKRTLKNNQCQFTTVQKVKQVYW